ncbi:3-alpha domain-containing protein [Nostoc sp.]
MLPLRFFGEQNDPELLHQAAQLEALPESWRDYFQEQSRRQDKSNSQ